MDTAQRGDRATRRSHTVAERARLEAALRESEERFRAFFDHAPTIVSFKDRDLRFRLVNRRMADALGLRPEDVIGRTARDIYPEQVAAALEAGDGEVLSSGNTVSLDLELPIASGATRAFLFVKFPVLDGAGTVLGVGTIATDVTDARRAQEALVESEGRFRHLAESADVGFVLRSVDPYEILYASPQVEAITGVSPEEVRRDPRALLARIHPDDQPAIAARLASRTPEPGELEFRMVAADGTVRWQRARTQPWIDETGRVTRVATTIEDITSWKQAGLELQAARTEAERANRVKSEFLSRMSHELRTPLTAILGFGELLELDPLTRDQRESVGHIRKAGRHLLALIDEILDISRIEAGELALSLAPVHLGELIDEAMQTVRPLALRRSVTLVFARATCEGHVLADRQRLKQVLLNLLSNAVKYNRKGGRVRVSCQASTPERRRISVADTGVGISDANLKRLFTPFERFDVGHSNAEGTGLGLALSKGLMEAIGGTIGAVSRLGEGSTFWVELAATDAVAAQPEASLEPAAASPRVEGTVLYVEDNPSNTQLVERILAMRSGVVLLTAIQGTLGLELAATHRPDLILLDLDLPDIHGGEVLRRLRADPRTSATPVVVISADATRRQIDRMLERGASDYLTKPFEVQRLLDWVDSALGGGPPPGAGRPDVSGPGRAASPLLSVLDERQVHALRELDDSGEALRRIATLFLDEAPDRLDELSRATAAGDADAARSAAHSLKGGALIIGASLLAAGAASVERVARRGRLPDEAALTDLRRTLEAARTAIQALIDEGRAPEG